MSDASPVSTENGLEIDTRTSRSTQGKGSTRFETPEAPAVVTSEKSPGKSPVLRSPTRTGGGPAPRGASPKSLEEARMTTTALGPLIHSFVEDFLKVRKALRPASIRSYRDVLRLFLNFAAEDAQRRITQLSVSDLTFERA